MGEICEAAVAVGYLGGIANKTRQVAGAHFKVVSYYYFANAFIAVSASEVTALSSAECS